MLRSGKVPIAKLEIATSEVTVQIPTERIPLLEEIYLVAHQEERFKRGELREFSTPPPYPSAELTVDSSRDQGICCRLRQDPATSSVTDAVARPSIILPGSFSWRPPDQQ